MSHRLLLALLLLLPLSGCPSGDDDDSAVSGDDDDGPNVGGLRQDSFAAQPQVRSCSQGDAPAGSLWWVLLLFAPLARRRR